MIIAGDIGGTKTVLGLFDQAQSGQAGSAENPAGLSLVRETTFSSQEHGSLAEILHKFLAAGPPVALSAAAFGVAGVVIDGRVRMTNLPWELDERSLAAALHAGRVKLLNDLEAAAYGMLHLKPDELCDLNPGSPKRKGNVVVIAAGTGLGEALLYWDGARYHPMASEGGHADFAPRSDLEIELLNYLREKYAPQGGHVSYERLLSGPGFYNIFEFLRQRTSWPGSQALIDEIEPLEPANRNAPIVKAGIERQDPLALAALDLFVSIYGAEAGNLALKCPAVGGVFVGGGIAPKMLPVLQNGTFMRSFCDKGRLSGVMQSFPVHVALNPRAPLLGAAYYASRPAAIAGS